MSRSTSESRADRIGDRLRTCSINSRSYASLLASFKRSRHRKKSCLSSPDSTEFEICQALDDNEVREMMQQRSTIEGSDSTHQSESTASPTTPADGSNEFSDIYYSCPTVSQKFSFSRLKQRFTLDKSRRTNDSADENNKNDGFLYVDQVDSDLVFIQGNIDQLNTRHGEPCEQGLIDDDHSMDISTVPLMPMTPLTPTLSPLLNTKTGVPQSISTHPSSNELEGQATQAGVECGGSLYDESTIANDSTQFSAPGSSTATNTSIDDQQLTNIDRSTLSTSDFIRRQKEAFERITVYEIGILNDYREYHQFWSDSENNEFDINERYDKATEENNRLRQELKRLEEEKDRVYSAWTCEVCTFINEPFIKTHRDVCEMCEGPSPLKRHTLTN